VSYSSARPIWVTELTLMFVLGFVFATALWLGLWFYHAQPSQAAAIDRKESALATCEEERDQFRHQSQQAQAQNGDLEKKLHDARVGWGQCIRGKGEAPASTDTAASKLP